MTGADDDGPPVPTVQPAAELFTRSVTALWATTYSVDLALFSEFLLPRLGDPPLNVTVLADYERLAASLARIPPERADTLATVNRRWLLRGVQAGGAFHPKTYLSATSRKATLLVGSGNLSVDGLDEGREVFTTFRSGTPVGDQALATWETWMRRLVQMVGDTTLAERFQDLGQRMPEPSADPAPGPSPLLHNLDSAIAGQLADIVRNEGDAEELLLAAPFYDADAVATGTLLDTIRPRRVTLFVTGTTSVNGESLARRLTASGAKVTVMAYEPDQFVHAKLVGVITGRGSWLLSGSANLSRAALTLTPRTHGNVELAVLTRMDPDALRAVFVPPEVEAVPSSIERLSSLDLWEEPAPELDQPLVRLTAVTALPDGRVEIVSDPEPEDGWLLDDLSARHPISADSGGQHRTSEPLAGRLVQIVGSNGQVLSNRAVVDDPVALNAALTASGARPDDDRPAELGSGDLGSTLGEALVWLHRNVVMDVSERADAAGVVKATIGEAGPTGDEEFWERLAKKQLAGDHRAGTYRGLWRPGLADTPPLIEFLEMLRARAPEGAAGQSLLATLLTPAPDRPVPEEDRPIRRWAMSTRIRVRARNLLRRWAAAQSDPHLQWVDPLAPVGNFAMITTALVAMRLVRASDPGQVEFNDDDLDDLWDDWLRAIVGTGEADGWLGQLDADTARHVRDRMPGWLPEAAAALTWLVIRPGTRYRERVIAFQPVLTAAFSHDLIEPTEETARYLAAITGQAITREQVDNDLLEAAEFIDDDLWCTRTAATLGVSRLRLRSSPGAAAIDVRLEVLGVPDPLLNPRIPRLITAARNYRRCDGVAVYAGDDTWRVVAVTGETVVFRLRPRTEMMESSGPLARGAIESLAAQGGALADLFPRA